MWSPCTRAASPPAGQSRGYWGHWGTDMTRHIRHSTPLTTLIITKLGLFLGLLPAQTSTGTSFSPSRPTAASQSPIRGCTWWGQRILDILEYQKKFWEKFNNSGFCLYLALAGRKEDFLPQKQNIRIITSLYGRNPTNQRERKENEENINNPIILFFNCEVLELPCRLCCAGTQRRVTSPVWSFTRHWPGLSRSYNKFSSLFFISQTESYKSYSLQLSNLSVMITYSEDSYFAKNLIKTSFHTVQILIYFYVFILHFSLRRMFNFLFVSRLDWLLKFNPTECSEKYLKFIKLFIGLINFRKILHIKITSPITTLQFDFSTDNVIEWRWREILI